MIKTCNKCNKEKELTLFMKGSKYKDGYRNVCKRCHTNYMIEYYKNNPEKNKEKIKMNSGKSPNWKRHKLTKEQFDNLISLYNGKCHSCKDRDAVNIDHDHKCCPSARSCGKCIRGILCNQCNSSLGLLNDDLEKINKLFEYLNSTMA